MPEHTHTLEPVLIRNPDLYYLASREDIVVARRCAACPHVEPSLGWNGKQRVRRNELCEHCDGRVEGTSAYAAQDMGRGPRRVIRYYQCVDCGHTQYYFKDDPTESAA